MMKFFLAPVIAMTALISIESIAASNFYQCHVTGDAHIKNSGALDVLRNSSRVGQQFAVMRDTGEVLGDVMDSLRNPKVIALGSQSNAYKVIWEQEAAGSNGVFVDYLSIDESVKGKRKPFGFFSGSLLLTGYCE
jgi:hypothetical protein